MSIIMAITHLTTQLLSERTQSFASSSEILTFFFHHSMLWETVIPSGIHNKLIIGHIVQQQRESCSYCFSLSCTYSEAKQQTSDTITETLFFSVFFPACPAAAECSASDMRS